MANSSSTVSTGDVITAAQYNNLRTDAIGPYGDERVFPDNTLLKFGTGEDASIYYDGTNLYIQPQDVGTGDVIINDAATLFVNDTANANMTVGITVNQGAADDQVFAAKSSDVNTGMTTGLDVPDVEVDDFFYLSKSAGLYGGALMVAMGEDDANLDNTFRLNAVGGQAGTAKTTAAVGLTDILVQEHDGANALADITADGNVFTIRARVGGSNVARLLVDEDGDLYSVTTAQTFDDYDDLALVDTYDKVRSGFHDWAVEHEKQLIDLKILGAPVAEGGLTNQSQLIRLLTGAVRQLGEDAQDLRNRLQVAESRLGMLPEGN